MCYCALEALSAQSRILPKYNDYGASPANCYGDALDFLHVSSL